MLWVFIRSASLEGMFSWRNKIIKTFLLKTKCIIWSYVDMNGKVRKLTFRHVRPTKTQISLHIHQSSICCPHKKILHPWLSKMCPVKILIRLRMHRQILAGRTSPKVCFLTLGAYIFYACSPLCKTQSHLFDK